MTGNHRASLPNTVVFLKSSLPTRKIPLEQEDHLRNPSLGFYRQKFDLAEHISAYLLWLLIRLSLDAATLPIKSSYAVDG
jgi:hypothetical protein